MHCFDVHGICVNCDLQLPGLLHLPECARQPSVFIAEGDLPSTLESPEIRREYYSASPGEVLLRARGAGRLWVRGGVTISYERATDGDDADLGAHILGSGIAAIHHQRGNVILHAGSIVLGGQAFLICGQSGAGKSTTTAHLLAEGGTMLGDDVAAIGEAPEFAVYPGPALAKLTDEALAGLPQMQEAPREGQCISGKTLVSTQSHQAGEPAPLRGVVELRANDVESLQIRQLLGVDAIAALRRNTFRKRFITSDSLPTLFAKWARLAEKIPIWQVTRPTGEETRAEVVTAVQRLIADMQDNNQKTEDDPSGSYG